MISNSPSITSLNSSRDSSEVFSSINNNNIKSRPKSTTNRSAKSKKQIAIDTRTDTLWTDTIALESNGKVNLNVNKILTQDLRSPNNNNSSLSLTMNSSLSDTSFVVTEEKLYSNNYTNIFLWPEKLKSNVIKSFNRPINEDHIVKYLSNKNWPKGLISTLIKTLHKIPLRFYVVDDSGSMTRRDGKKLSKSGLNSNIVECSRWAELTDSFKFLAELSEEIQAPSDFRLLNGAEPVMVGLGDDNKEGLKFLLEVFNETPLGQTPLCIHITSIVATIESLSQKLKQSNQKVAIIIATDGLATDGSVIEALRPLQKLPVWLVIRLCTNEPDVVSFWNNIDKELEIELDVIDDFVNESLEVKKVNPWIIYGEPLHRLREFGASMKVIDLLDEKILSNEQVRDVCTAILSDGKSIDIPHPEINFKEFIRITKLYNNKKTLCPNTCKMKPWIDIEKIKHIYGTKQYSPFTCTVS